MNYFIDLEGFTVSTTSIVSAAKYLSVAFIPAFLLYCFTWYQKQNDYKNDYYKKIIKIRLETYMLVQELLATLAHLTKDTVDNKCYYTLFRFTKLDYILNFNLDLNNNYKLQGEGDVPILSESRLNSYGFGLFINKLATALSKRAWLSTELVEELGKVKAIWDTIGIELEEMVEARLKSADRSVMSDDDLKNIKETTVPDLVIVGKKHYDELENIECKIREYAHRDISDLHKVNKFIKEKKSDKKIRAIPTPYVFKP